MGDDGNNWIMRVTGAIRYLPDYDVEEAEQIIRNEFAEGHTEISVILEGRRRFDYIIGNDTPDSFIARVIAAYPEKEASSRDDGEPTLSNTTEVRK